MYELTPPLPEHHGAVEPGLYFLTGPAMTDKRAIVAGLLAAGVERGDQALLVSTAGRSGAWAELPAGTDGGEVALIDASPEGDSGASGSTVSTGGPGDLTGLGMYLTRWLGNAGTDPPAGVRVGMLSISTLLMYSDYETVFRFLHVVRNRLRGAGAVGVFALNTDDVNAGAVEGLVQVGDGQLECRRDADGSPEVRVTRGDGDWTDWAPAVESVSSERTG